MKLECVASTFWCTRKDVSLESFQLLVAEDLAPGVQREGGYAVAVGSVGSELGEVVLHAGESSARLTPVTKDKPVDAVIMAIVDSFDIDGKVTHLA